MNHYVYIYHSNQTSAPSGETLKAWSDWFDTLGDHVVDAGSPITNSKAILKDGLSAKEQDSVIGYAIIKATNLDEAIDLAKNNPLAQAPGYEIRVYETGQM